VRFLSIAWSVLDLISQSLPHLAGGDATWLRSPPLPKPFVLELLDFILNASADLFRTLHDFESAVTGRVSSLNASQAYRLQPRGADG